MLLQTVSGGDWRGAGFACALVALSKVCCEPMLQKWWRGVLSQKGVETACCEYCDQGRELWL